MKHLWIGIVRGALVLTAIAGLFGCGTGLGGDTGPSSPLIAAREGETVTPSFSGTTAQLRIGWNALGMRGLPVTSLSSSNVAGFAFWDGANYQTGALDLANLNDNGGARRGLWVFATAPGNITYTANDPTAVSTDMRAGWNLLAFPAPAPVAGSSLVTRADGQVVPLASVLLTQFSEINEDNTYTTRDVGTGAQVSPGKAYWVFASRAVTLSYSAGPAPSPTASPAGALVSVNFGFNEISTIYGISDDGRYLAGTGRLPVEPSRDHGIQADLDTRSFVDNPFRDGLPVNSGGGAGPMATDGNMQFLRGVSGSTPFLAVYTRSTNTNAFLSSGPIGNQLMSAAGHFLAWTGVSGQFSDVFTKASTGSTPPSGLKERVPALDVADRNYTLRSLSDDGHFVLFLDQAQVQSGGSTPDRKVRRVDITTNEITLAIDSNDYPRMFMSGDGRIVFFDTGQQAYVRTIGLSDTELVSESSTQVVGNAPSTAVAISTDGRFVLFTSDASNLVPNDVNAANDAFLRDRQSRTTVRVSVDSDGNQFPAVLGTTSIQARMSRNGKWIVFKDPVGGSMLRVRNPAL